MNPHNPIDHVVIIVKENHTFDNYFGTFPGVNGINTLPHAADPPAGGDPLHTHAAWLETISGAHTAVREQYHESDIPAYFAYARQFTLCDNYFTEIASQSEPNHLMLIAAFHSHVSIVRFCEKTFGLPALNKRDAASDDMSDCFNFNQIPLPPPVWPVANPSPHGSPKPKPGKHA